MLPERILLTAHVDALLLGEPVIESRLMTEDDLPGLAQLFADSVSVGVAEARDDLNSYAAGMFGAPMWGLWRGIFEGQPVPVSAVLYSMMNGMPVIVELLTAPAYRNRGHASSIVRETAVQLKANGVERIGVIVKPNSPSKFLLEELGFVETLEPERVR
jgi:ribosomal protein S18 acetylase RimI-like enzyme